jgi:type II secretory pathway component PulJ
LLEVLLAVTLAVALVIAMLAFYRQVADVREVIGAEADTINAERTVMDLATGELRCALAYAPANLGLAGTTSEMRFATTTVPGADAWLVPSVVDSPLNLSGGDVRIVGYRLQTSQDEQGNPIVDGIARTVQKQPTATGTDGVLEEGKQIQVKLLAPSWKFMRLRYWDGSAWLDAWSQADLPGAVEIVLGEKPLPDGVAPADYGYPIFSRVVFIPAGAKALSGTVILGLDGSATP